MPLRPRSRQTAHHPEDRRRAPRAETLSRGAAALSRSGRAEANAASARGQIAHVLLERHRAAAATEQHPTASAMTRVFAFTCRGAPLTKAPGAHPRRSLAPSRSLSSGLSRPVPSRLFSPLGIASGATFFCLAAPPFRSHPAPPGSPARGTRANGPPPERSADTGLCATSRFAMSCPRRWRPPCPPASPPSGPGR